MNENADLIFGVDTSEAVGNLNRLSKALQGVYDQMGKGSANPSRALAKNTEEMGAAAKVASVEFDELARKANDAARVMVSSSRKIGDAYVSIRSEATSSAEAIKKWERAIEEAANNPETVAGYERQKQQIKDLADYNERLQRNMTDAFHKELDRRNKLVAQKGQELEKYNKAVQTNMTELYYKELHRRSEAVRKENEKQLAYQRDLELNMQSLVAREMKRRADYAKGVHDNMTQAYVAELHRREQAEREHQNTMARLEREAWNRKKRMDAEKIAYLSRSSASQLQLLEEINLLSNQGISTSALARRFGSFAVTRPRSEEALAALRKEVEAQRAVEAAERALNKERSRGEPLTNRSTDAILRNNRAMHDARGLARGLTGALGQLWLTYGAVGPLLAGAAVGSIARQTYTVGKDVEYRLKMLEALGNRPVSISEMMPAVHGSMKTPLEAAQGLQELAQAGLDANQSLSVLNTTLQLATLGEMSVAEAALTTTAALSTFHLEVSEAARVGDVFAKTASVSNTTVKGIAEAMKQAGSAASIYGVTLEETSAQIAVLAQNGIRGSAAGTAIRNAMTELHAPTKKAQEIMKQMNIEMYEDGQARNYIDVLEDLRRVYYSLDEAGQNALLKGMFNERSRRAIQIYMQDLDLLKGTIETLADSQLFLLDANLKLLDTVEGASNRMQSVLQQSLVESFDQLKPSIMSTVQALEAMFASEGFKTGVQTIGGTVANLTELMTKHSETLVYVAGAYATLRVAAGALGGSVAAIMLLKDGLQRSTTNNARAIGVETAALTANTAATNANNAAKAGMAARAVTVAAGAVRMLNVVGLITAAAFTAASAIRSYSRATGELSNSQNNAIPNLDSVTTSLRLQNEELLRNIMLQREKDRGLTPGVSNVDAARMSAQEVINELSSREIALQMQQEGLQQRINKLKEQSVRDNPTAPADLNEAILQQKKVAKEIDEVRISLDKATTSLKENERMWAEVSKNTRIHSENTTADQANRIYKELENIEKFADPKTINEPLRKILNEAKALNQQYLSGQITDMDEYRFRMEQLSMEAQKHRNTFTLPDPGDSGKGMARALERFEEWYAKQKLAITTLNQLTDAYLQGEEHLRKYHLEQEIGNVQIKDRTKHEKEIAEILTAKNRAEEINNIAKEAYELSKQTKTADEYVDVLLAQSKGYKEGEAALKKFNKEQALNALLSKTSAENSEELLEVIRKFNEEYDRNEAANDRNQKLEKLNDLVNQTKNSTQRYREEMQRLEELRPFAKTTEQVIALEQAIRNLEIESNDFLSTFNQGFEDLNQNANDMWRKFLEDGKFSMDSVKSLFRNMLADLAHQALTKPIIISLQNAVMGTNVAGGWSDVWGGGGAQGSVSKALGGGGNFSLLTGFAGSAAGSVQSIGGTLASMDGILGDFGANLVMHSDTIGKALDWGGAALSYGSSIYQLSKGNWGAGIGGAAGQLVGGPIGSFIGSSLGGMLDKAFKGETRSGGGFQYRDGQTRFVGGPSGGYGGIQTLREMDNLLKGATDTVNSLFTMLEANARADFFAASFESSTKGRGGTQSNVGLQVGSGYAHVGSFGKGSGYGGKTGTAEEMFENMTKDMVFTTLEAWKAASSELPRTISAMLDNVDIRAGSVEQAEELANRIMGITTEITGLNQALQSTPLEAFKNMTFDLAYQTSVAAGGVGNLTQGISSFYDKFYTETEKHTHNTNQLTSALWSLNMELPLSREGFRHLIDSLGQVNEANKETITTLLGLSDLADRYYLEEERRAEQRHQEELRRQEEAYRNAQSYTDKLMNEFRNLAQKQIQELQGVSKTTDNIAQALSRALNSQISSIQSITSSLETTIRSLRSSAGVGGMQAAQGWNLINQTIRTGKLPGESDLNAAITAIQQSFSNGSYMSAFERDRDQLLLANKLEEINEIAGPQLSIAEQQLKVMEDQLAELRDGTKRAITLANLSKEQVEAIRNVDEKTAASVGLSQEQVAKLRDNNEYAKVLENLTRDQIQGILGVKGEATNIYGLTQQQLAELKNNTGVSSVIKSLTDLQLGKLKDVDSKTATALGLSNSQYEALKTGNKELIALQGLSSDQIEGILGVKGETSNLYGLSQSQIDALKDVDTNTQDVAELNRRFQTAVEAESLANKQIEKIQDQLETMQDQYEQLRKLNATMETLDEGMRLLADAMDAERASKPSTGTGTGTGTGSGSKTPKFGDEDFKFTSQAQARKYILGNTGLLGAGMAVEVSQGWTSPTDFMKYAQHHYDMFGREEGRPLQDVKNLGRTHKPGTYAEGHAYVANHTDLLNAYLKAVQTQPWYASETGLLAWARWHYDNKGPNEVRRYAKGGYHPGGLRLVGEYGPELEVTGPGRIHNVHRTQQMLDSLQHGSNKTLDENGQLAVLTQEVRNLREDNNRVIRALIEMQHRNVRMLERWETDGLPETRVWEIDSEQFSGGSLR